ncbi:MAG TPA: ArsB/NhaD family transporter, partial [Actinomycetes bacterium]|nr:ArsB/NhaD family transporter [Actinomycetes bacterium]
MTTTLVVAGFVGAYILIATERIHRVAAALGGAAFMVAVGVVDAETAFFSEETGVDWNVIFLLLGMMIIISVLKQTGVFDYVAIWAAKRARGKPFAVMVLLTMITAVASALLDNVTTVLLIAPVTLLVCERLGAPPIPFLIAEALASNIGGTATLIGDPPNIIIASRADLSFNEFLINLGPIVVVLLGVFVLLIRILFRHAFHYDEERAAAVMDLDEREVIRDKGLLIRSLVVLFGVMVGFVLHSALHLEPSVVALLGAGTLVAVSRLDPPDFLEEVEWSTLVFFMGLFVMVGALVEVGVIETLGEQLTEAVGDNYFLAASVLLWGSALLSGIVDNIPYVATMTPLVQGLVDSGGGATQSNALWWALALGADLGGNSTAVGASANVVVIGIAARNGHP